MDAEKPLCLHAGRTVSNWSATFSCHPDLYGEPQDLDELRQILTFARRNNRKVKVMGFGHSPSDIAFTDDILVSLKRMPKILKMDRENCRVTVEGGAMLDELNYQLKDNGMAFSVLPSISNLTAAGAVGTATHGSGIKYGTLSSSVVNMELLMADGSMLLCSPTENADVFHAACCGLGAIGIIVSLTFQCEPSFNLEQKQYGRKLDTVLENLGDYMESSEHFKFLWYPHTEDAVRKDPVPASVWFWTLLLRWTNHFVEFLYWISMKAAEQFRQETFFKCSYSFYPSTNVHLGRQHIKSTKSHSVNNICRPRFSVTISSYLTFVTPWINRFAYFLHKVPTQVNDISYNVFNFDCLFKQFVSDWAIPVEETASALRELKDWLHDQKGKVVAHFPVEIRFVKADDSFMSPANGRDSTYINIIMYRPYGKDITREKYWTSYENIMERHRGRPHWAKEHKITAAKLARMYPRFNDWCRIRESLDPSGMFINPYIARILEQPYQTSGQQSGEIPHKL